MSSIIYRVSFITSVDNSEGEKVHCQL